jgi:hypothetical protein
MYCVVFYEISQNVLIIVVLLCCLLINTLYSSNRNIPLLQFIDSLSHFLFLMIEHLLYAIIVILHETSILHINIRMVNMVVSH